MSTLKVNGIRGTSASSDAITIHASDGTATAKLTSVTDLQSINDGGIGGSKNLLINGAMKVNQRGTVANAGNEYGGPDRMYFWKNDGAMTVSQDTDSPDGFGYSWKCDVTSVSGTAGSNYVALEQRLEGQDLQHIKKGTASAKQLTLTFWIKSTKTGTYIAELWDNDNSRSCSKSYTVSTTNTWEKKTITFPADTTGALGNDTGYSLGVILWIFAGSSYTSGTLQAGWQTTAANRAVGQVNGGDNTSNNIFFTGLQLEIGSTATEFEETKFSDELWRCRRYCQGSKGDDNDFLLGPGYEGGSGSFYLPVMLNPPMRAQPAMKIYSGDWKQVGQAGQSTNYTGVMASFDNQPGPIFTAFLLWKDTDYPSSKDGRTQWMRADSDGTIITLESEI